MDGYVALLRSFDSHERGILLRWATGSEFLLAPSVRDLLGERIGRDIPEDAFVAVDYTLDWLYATTRMLIDDSEEGRLRPRPNGRELTASPEDIDLLVAWEDEQGSHTLLVEAKGFTGWGNRQMASKAHRLDAIFSGELSEIFDVHFVLVGPTQSRGLTSTDWPAWMRREDRVHFEPIPDPGPRRAVQRCDAEGRPTKTQYSHWRAVSRTWSSSVPTSAGHVREGRPSRGRKHDPAGPGVLGALMQP